MSNKIIRFEEKDYHRAHFYAQYADLKGWGEKPLTKKQFREAAEFIESSRLAEGEFWTKKLDARRKEKASARDRAMKLVMEEIENLPERKEDALVREWSDPKVRALLWDLHDEGVKYNVEQHEKDFRDKVKRLAAKFEGVGKTKSGNQSRKCKWGTVFDKAKGISVDAAMLLKHFEGLSKGKHLDSTEGAFWIEKFKSVDLFYYAPKGESKRYLSVHIRMPKVGLHLTVKEAIEKGFLTDSPQ